jgi:hypothetical protein
MEGERSAKFIDELRVYKFCNSHIHNPGLVCVGCSFLGERLLYPFLGAVELSASSPHNPFTNFNISQSRQGSKNGARLPLQVFES